MKGKHCSPVTFGRWLIPAFIVLVQRGCWDKGHGTEGGGWGLELQSEQTRLLGVRRAAMRVGSSRPTAGHGRGDPLEPPAPRPPTSASVLDHVVLLLALLLQLEDPLL